MLDYLPSTKTINLIVIYKQKLLKSAKKEILDMRQTKDLSFDF